MSAYCYRDKRWVTEREQTNVGIEETMWNIYIKWKNNNWKSENNDGLKTTNNKEKEKLKSYLREMMNKVY